LPSLRGKVVLITGASRGLGRCLAKKLDKLGCKLICWDVDTDGLESLKKKLSTSVMHVFQTVDVANPDAIQEAISKSPLQAIDIVIGNAGIVSGKSVLELDVSAYERTIQVNLLQHVYLFKLLAQKMVSTDSMLPPTFVMVSSVCGTLALTHLSDYCASKFGLIGLAEGIRLDLRKCNSPINTMLVLPFLINTHMFKGVSVKWPARILLKPLKKDRVTDSIIHGIQTRKQWLVLPWILRFAPLMLVLPVWMRNFLHDLIGEHSYMDSFAGSGKTFGEARRLKSLLDTPIPEAIRKKIR
jgi:all-trans-retinol dehydrogenase (NAD+)